MCNLLLASLLNEASEKNEKSFTYVCTLSFVGGRMLLIVSLTSERPAEGGRKRVRHEKVQPGSVVEGTVIKAHPLHVDVQLADGGEIP